MIGNFMGCRDIVPFCDESVDSSASFAKGYLKTEVTLVFDMSFSNCSECAGVSFIFNERNVPRNLTFNFDYEYGSPLSLIVLLKDKNKRVYRSLNVSGRDNLPLSGMIRSCTSEISVVCPKKENIGKKGQVRIYL